MVKESQWIVSSTELQLVDNDFWECPLIIFKYFHIDITHGPLTPLLGRDLGLDSDGRLILGEDYVQKE